MHPAQIKAALSVAGYSQTAAAAACGVKPTTIGAVIHGRSRSKVVEDWIADVIGVEAAVVWPQWYATRSVRDDAGLYGLTDTERQIVQTFRALNPTQQEQAKAMLTVIGLGLNFGPQTPGVTVTGGRIAGRDIISNKGTKNSPKK